MIYQKMQIENTPTFHISNNDNDNNTTTTNNSN